MINRIVLAGRLVREPETSYTTAGVAVTKFTLAVDRPGKKEGGKEADFVPVVAWRKPAEIAGEWFCKGLLVSVEGRLQIRRYVGRDGQPRYATEVVADGVGFLESRAVRERLQSGGPEVAGSESDPLDDPQYEPVKTAPVAVTPSGRNGLAGPAGSVPPADPDDLDPFGEG